MSANANKTSPFRATAVERYARIGQATVSVRRRQVRCWSGCGCCARDAGCWRRLCGRLAVPRRLMARRVPVVLQLSRVSAAQLFNDGARFPRRTGVAECREACDSRSARQPTACSGGARLRPAGQGYASGPGVRPRAAARHLRGTSTTSSSSTLVSRRVGVVVGHRQRRLQPNSTPASRAYCSRSGGQAFQRRTRGGGRRG